MNRIAHFVGVGLLAAAAEEFPPVAQAASLATSQGPAADTAKSPAALTAFLASSLALRVAIDNNHANAAGVPCAERNGACPQHRPNPPIAYHMIRMTGPRWPPRG